MPNLEGALSIEAVSEAFPQYEDVQECKGGAQACLFRVRADGEAAFALKLYDLSSALVRSERVEWEVEALQALQCPHLATLIGGGTQDILGRPWMWTLTEFIEGEDLERALEARSRLTPDANVSLLACIGCAIDALWSLHIVHCDIKPANIMERTGGGFVLVDLGIAKHLDQPTVTEYGMVMGTRGFMSPEQMVNRRGLTRLSDIFSLGVVAYLASTGVHPFEWNQLLVPRLTPIPPAEVADVPRPVSDIIMAMLAKNPLRRPRSGQAIANTLLEGA